MINVKLIGGLGNNMFQYALGRILAEEKNCNLIVDGIESLTKYFPNVTNITDRKELMGLTLHLGYNSANKTVQHIDYAEVKLHNGPISLEGFFQKYNLYVNYLPQIKHWFSYDESLYTTPSENDLVIHYRLGDYLSLHWNLLPDDYIAIIENQLLSYEQCYIITDDVNNPLCLKLLNLKNSKIIKQTELQDFTFMKHAKQLILSHSSFSWWSAFLGNQEHVYVPLFKDKFSYLWKIDPQLDDVDLLIDNYKFKKVLL